MKVQGVNSSSKKTRNLIKKTFAELIEEKKELSKITVTELVKRADITRATFYTHYDDIYEVASEYQSETIELLDNILNSKQDIYECFDDALDFLKKNEKIYKMLLSSNEALSFLEKLKKMFSQKIYYDLSNKFSKSKYLQLDLSFFMDGFINQLIRYFRDESDYTLDEIFINAKKWFKEIFD